MRPVNQPPLSLSAMKRSPLGSSRPPDKPPKPRKREDSTSPLRYSKEPKRTRERSRGSQDGIGRASAPIATAAATEDWSVAPGFRAGRGAGYARARPRRHAAP